jgi:ABC-type polysaccharide/polyol phosphate export permease
MTGVTVTGQAPTWEHRMARAAHWADLVRVLAVKNFRQRYLRSRLGVVWALIQPLLQAAVLSFVFVVIFKVKSVPHYPLYVLSGIMSWQFFQQSALAGTSSIVDNAGLVRKVAVPKVVFPIAAVGGVGLVFVLQLVILIGAGAVLGTLHATSPLLLLLAIPLEAAFALSLSVLCTSIHVKVRDIRFVVESGLLMAFYLTPVLWDLNRLSPTLRAVMEWNPMLGVLSLVRGAILGRAVDWTGVGSAFLCAAVLGVVGAWVFRRRSPEFADLA